MYKNFNLTEKERQQILESHKSHGYRKPLNEQMNQMRMSKNNDEPNLGQEEFVTRFSGNKPLYKRVYFNNGGDISIQASATAYCEPRDNYGPYTQMELGYPNKNTVLPKSVLDYVEQSAINYNDGLYRGNDPYDSVYPYVPVSVVKKLIQANGGVKSGEVPPLDEVNDDYGDRHSGKERVDEDFDGMASNIEPYSKFKSAEKLMKSITDRLITAVQLQEWSLVKEVTSDLISYMKNQPSNKPMKDDYESSVENDDYDERQERNYGVED